MPARKEKSMPQMLVPIIAPGTTMISQRLSVANEEDTWTYFHGAFPVFSHKASERKMFRLITAQLVCNGVCRQVDIIKAFGAGTGLSDADREYALKAAAGDITMTEESLRRIIYLNEIASRTLILKHNDQITPKFEDAAKSAGILFDLKAEVPPLSSSMIRELSRRVLEGTATEAELRIFDGI